MSRPEASGRLSSTTYPDLSPSKIRSPEECQRMSFMSLYRGVIQTGSISELLPTSKKKTVLSWPTVNKCFPSFENSIWVTGASCTFQAPKSLKLDFSMRISRARPFLKPAARMRPWLYLLEGAQARQSPTPSNFWK